MLSYSKGIRQFLFLHTRLGVTKQSSWVSLARLLDSWLILTFLFCCLRNLWLFSNSLGFYNMHHPVGVQLLNRVQLFATPWTVARQASLSFTVSWTLLKFMFIESGMPSNHLALCCPLLLWPVSIFPSLRVFSNDSSHQVAKVFELQYQSFQWIFRVDSFRIDWLDLLAVQGTLKSLSQHHKSKARILWHSAFFMVQLSDLYMNTGKTIALTIWTFVNKVSLLFQSLLIF